MDIFKKPLFIFELANNHQGDIELGLKIIRKLAELKKNFDFNFAVKMQYRDLDTFIHPTHKKSSSDKMVNRFMGTRLTREQQKTFKDEIAKQGFYSICTPFDENSVDLVEEHGYDVIKIASCSFGDWPLMERIVRCDKPIIASTAGVPLNDIDNVVSFFTHRNKDIALMHCVAEYPTVPKNLQLNQIDLLIKRYPGLNIGYSTHEEPGNFASIKIAVSKGARIFEKHVGINTDTVKLNAYSATPEQLVSWLNAAREAFEMCGEEGVRHQFTRKEIDDLMSLRRGVFAGRVIAKGEKIDESNTYLAMPNLKNQVLANDLSKYKNYYAETEINKDDPVYFDQVKLIDIRGQVAEIITRVKALVNEAGIPVQDGLYFELSHHYGIDNFASIGASIINYINREYCKKIIIMVPGQSHPEHYHKKKEETFHILYGDITIRLNGAEMKCRQGDLVLVERGAVHSFSTDNGGIFEEISTTHYMNDSYYLDPKIAENKKRKTELTYWRAD